MVSYDFGANPLFEMVLDEPREIEKRKHIQIRYPKNCTRRWMEGKEDKWKTNIIIIIMLKWA